MLRRLSARRASLRERCWVFDEGQPRRKREKDAERCLATEPSTPRASGEMREGQRARLHGSRWSIRPGQCVM